MSDRLALAVAELVDALRAEMAVETRPADVERLMSIPEAAAACGIGRTAFYGLMSAGRVRVVRVGRRVLIPASAIAELVADAR